MPSVVTREEFRALELEVEGEKLVTRHILEQTRRNGDDLATVNTRLDRVEQKVDGLDKKVEGVDRKLEGVDRKVDGLARSLPRIVGDAVREVLRERDGK